LLISEAKAFVGSFVKLTYKDRMGNETEKVVEVFDVNFVPLYGPCMITDAGDFRLDRVSACSLLEERKAA
jgi:predicted DNA-binding transcriptional regulator YafY